MAPITAKGDKKMLVVANHEGKLNDFLEFNKFMLAKNATRAAENIEIYYPEERENYIVIKIGKYYNLAKVVSEIAPNIYEVDKYIYPFDADHIYPMQELEIKANYR